MTYLNPNQRRRVEELARQQGISCPNSDSHRLESDNYALKHFGGVDIDLRCVDEDLKLPEPLSLSTEQARRLGIDMDAYGGPET